VVAEDVQAARTFDAGVNSCAACASSATSMPGLRFHDLLVDDGINVRLFILNLDFVPARHKRQSCLREMEKVGVRLVNTSGACREAAGTVTGRRGRKRRAVGEEPDVRSCGRM
jgi:hypothetical protein